MGKKIVQRQDITGYLRDWKDNLAKFATRKYDRTNFLNSIFMAFNGNDKLMECLTTKEGTESVYHSLQIAATNGLSLNPLEGKACLVPYRKKVGNNNYVMTCSYQVMKNGFVELTMDTNKIELLTCDVVRKNDRFDFIKTSDGDKWEFMPAKTNRGAIQGFFAGIKLKTGISYLVYMTDEEMQEWRKNYAATPLDKAYVAWNRSYVGMGLKTVLKYLLRNTHIAPEIQSVVTTDDASEAPVIDIQTLPEEPHKGISSDDALKQLENQKPIEPEPEKKPAHPAVESNDGELF